MWLSENASGWSDDFCDDLDCEVDLTPEELAESNRIRDRALKALSAQPSLDPASWDLPDLALMEGDECRLN